MANAMLETVGALAVLASVATRVAWWRRELAARQASRRQAAQHDSTGRSPV